MSWEKTKAFLCACAMCAVFMVSSANAQSGVSVALTDYDRFASYVEASHEAQVGSIEDPFQRASYESRQVGGASNVVADAAPAAPVAVKRSGSSFPVVAAMGGVFALGVLLLGINFAVVRSRQNGAVAMML